MRLLLSLLYIVLYTTLFAQDSPQSKEFLTIVESERKGHTSHIDFVANPLTQDYDIRYHRLEWTVDPAVASIQGKVTTWFEPLMDGFSVVHFDLSSNMVVEEVRYHGNTIPFTLSGSDDLQITIPTGLNAGVLDSISVQYSGTPKNTGFGSFVASTHDGTPVMWTLSEPYGAKHWWPCKQDLTDKIDSIDVFVTTPESYRVASNGLLLETIPNGNEVVYHWKHTFPIAAYLVAFAVTDYASYSDFVPLSNGDTVEVLNYVYPENLATAKSQTPAIIEIMQLYSELFIPYPFAREKYGHAQCGFGGGMEHQTMSFMGNFGYELQAHELAHQWFGDYITCGSWEDIWLNEGFATYLSGLCYENLQPQYWTSFKQGRIQNIVSQPGGSVWVNDTTSVNRVFSGRLTYAKGAMVLHMLRWVVGDENFFHGIRNYLLDPNLAFSYARTSDLKAHLESQSGMDLNVFFNQWIYGEGFPSYLVAWWPIMNGVHIRLDQTTSSPVVPFFILPVPVRAFGPGVDTLLRLDHMVSGQGFDVLLPFQVDSIAFDPYLWLISANNTVDMIVATEEPSMTDIEARITISPNPVMDHFSISLPLAIQDEWQVVVWNSQGQIKHSTSSVGGMVDISTASWPAGSYLITMTAEDFRVIRRVVRL